MTTSLVWFRGKDLRLADHAPLHDALSAGPALTVFVVDPFFFNAQRAGELPHRMQFMLASLTALRRDIAARGGALICVHGRSTDIIPQLAQAWSVDRVVAYRWT
ncbi:MAG: deoxyribodipyrimidine photo-lyase, partial [Pseudomonadota bacterium]|nr:deoxyribodipyrimidine photo-lyase [Pseudomonadota bacterium]